MWDLLIKGGWIITLDRSRRIISDGYVAINNGDIVEVGKLSKLKNNCAAKKTVEATEKVVVPGLVNLHVHTSEQLGRGMADEIDRLSWVFNRTLPYEAALTFEEVYLSSLLCCAEMIRTGTTTFTEAGAHPLYYDATANAIIESGMRANIGKHGIDRNSVVYPIPAVLHEETEESLSRSVQLIEKWHGAGDGRIRGSIVVTTPHTATTALFQKSKKVADELGVLLQSHISFGGIRDLAKLGVLGPNCSGSR